MHTLHLFITDDEDGRAETWKPDAGENAVIIQPGINNLAHIDKSTGPTIYKMVKTADNSNLIPESREFKVLLTEGEDPDYVDEETRWEWEDNKLEEYSKLLDGNKIAGTPGFLQSDEFPSDGHWNLLLQLDSADVPFSINFGDAGIGYAFISVDGKEGKFLWQCA